VNNAGQVVFNSELTGGDVVGTTNNNGLWISGPSGTSMIMRRGDQAPGLASGVLLGPAPTFGYLNNANGRTWFGNRLTGAGIVDANNDALFGTVDGSLSFIAREGESQGLPASTNYASASNFVTPFTPVGLGITQNNSAWYAASLGGAAVTTANDQALMRYNSGTFSTEWRKGDATPITGVNFGSLNTGNSGLSRNEFATLATSLVDAGGGVTSSNDESIWFKQMGQSPVLIARENSLLTSFGELGNLAGLPADATFAVGGSMVSGSFTNVNILGQVIFQGRVSGTGITANVNDSALFYWDALTGLSVIARTGTVLDPLMGTITQVNVTNTNYAEGVAGLSDNGWITFRTRDSVGNTAIYRVQVPAPGAVGALAIGLALASRRRRK
jgi:hypothetical protein